MPPLRRIDREDDPDLLLYQSLRAHSRRRGDGRFLCEGAPVVERALRAGITVESVLVIEKRLDRIQHHIPPQVSLLVIPDRWLDRVAGRGHQTGVYACGRHPGWQNEHGAVTTLMTLAGRPDPILLALPRVTTPRNLGAILRVAAGLGVEGVLLGEQCTDPFHRQVVRASMGTLFTIPMVRSTAYADDLEQLAHDHDTLHIAVTTSEDALSLYDLDHHLPATPNRPVCLILGHESDGLDPAIESRCPLRLTLPMQRGVDSLNVATATAIFVHELMRRRHLSTNPSAK
ncbi:MAG: RNA methyltransferase [Magnetococcales bacterium]|nr:RNA methyltransferase [Magnetococcales bacterium]